MSLDISFGTFQHPASGSEDEKLCHNNITPVNTKQEDWIGVIEHSHLFIIRSMTCTVTNSLSFFFTFFFLMDAEFGTDALSQC